LEATSPPSASTHAATPTRERWANVLYGKTTLLWPPSEGNQNEEHGMIEVDVKSAHLGLVSYVPDDRLKAEKWE
jgi:hypothetical protein